jgi:ribulose-5-phosphate 4-epimerase/fuculose-1-phosphate aldolase
MNIIDSTPAGVEPVLDIKLHSRRALADTAQESCRRHLTVSGHGIISLRLPVADLFLITPYETSLEDLRSEDLCLINGRGEVIEGDSGSLLPPETKFHLKSFAVRTDINVIAHLYPPSASAYAARNEVFDLVTETARSQIKEVLRVQCGECISRFCGLCSCRTDIRVSYAGVNVMLLKEDGLVILGASLDDALNLTDIAEETARIASSTTR